MSGKAYLILILLLAVQGNLFYGKSQITGYVEGVVTCFKTCPLNKAVVKSLKTGHTVTTDSLGRFSVMHADKDVLLVTAGGFISQKIKLRNARKIYINLNYKFGETSFKDAVEGGHISENALKKSLEKYPRTGQNDYSTYHDIYRLIRQEYPFLRIDGTNVFNTQAISFSMSQQVLYVVNGMVVNDISTISPGEIKKLEFLKDNEASEYGVRGANGVLRITLK